MDRTRFKRPDIQKQRQTPKQTFGNSSFVPKALPARPRPVQMVMTQTVTPPQPVYRRAPSLATPSQNKTRPQTQQIPVQVQPARPQPLAPQSTTSVPARSNYAQPTTAASPAVLARRLPIDMELPGEESPWHLGNTVSRFKVRRFRRLAMRGAALSLVLMITMGGLLFSQTYLKANKVFRGGTGTAAALKANPKPELLKGEGRGRVNILLLGRGGGGHTAPDLTDTLMIASVDPVNHKTTLLSVPRDIWVNVPNYGVMKINAAWQAGVHKYLGRSVNGSTDNKAIQAGFKAIDDTLKEVTGLSIDYHVLVDFKAFKQAVDSVGGVNIDVATELVDPTMAWENNNDPVLAKAGPQSFDGNKALMYARSRATTSDFARGDRQRALLLALKAKVATVGTLSNPAKISGLLNAFGDNVQTDLSLSNANRLYGILKNVQNANVTSLSLADPANSYLTTGNVNGQSTVIPKAGLFKYDDIQNFLRTQLKDPYIVKEKAKILVLNGTTLPGVATTKAAELTSYGYNVFKIGNTPNTGWTSTTLIDLTKKKKYTRNYLEQRFNQPATSELADKTIPTNGADFVIIIGSNEASLTNNQTN